jgi:hypothetical protein
MAVSPFQTKYSRRLPSQLVNDKGRYRQYSARSQSPELSCHNRLQISVISEALSECAAAARNSIPLEKGLGTVDVNVLYQTLQNRRPDCRVRSLFTPT